LEGRRQKADEAKRNPAKREGRKGKGRREAGEWKRQKIIVYISCYQIVDS
jgi:hypothetical protein